MYITFPLQITLLWTFETARYSRLYDMDIESHKKRGIWGPYAKSENCID